MENKLPDEIQAILDEGRGLMNGAIDHFNKYLWLTEKLEQSMDPTTEYESLPYEYKMKLPTFKHDLTVWFNTVGVRILPFVLEHKDWLHHRRTIVQSLFGKGIAPQGAINALRENMNLVLELIETFPPSANSYAKQDQPSVTHTPNTAFILMAMSRANPSLTDVLNAFKEVCRQFGIDAVRADEVEHQERITDVILHKIENSEFIIADLTDERPNVYYEVGYAHAKGKRPILFRKTATRLHFDLAGFNVPEYENLTQLRELLRKRLEAITGRVPKQS